MNEYEQLQNITNFRNDDNTEEIDNTTKNIPSYVSLIRWNISKVLEDNPQIDLRVALQNTNEKLVNNVVDKKGDDQTEHYLKCAVLAWQLCMDSQNIDHLYEYIIQNLNNNNRSPKTEPREFNNSNNSLFASDCSLFVSRHAFPIKPTIVMSLDEKKKCTGMKCAKDNKLRPPPSSTTPSPKPSFVKHPPCCKAVGCADRLEVLGASTAALRKRATELAKRETKRMEILEKAENSWKDLETRYRRRINFGEQAERNLNKDIEKMIQERNESKEACETLMEELKEKSIVIEEDRKKLVQLEKEVQEKYILRRDFTAEIAKGDSRLVDEQMKGSQIDRDNQYKEEKTRRKIAVLQSELDATQFLEFESQRAMKEDLTVLKKEIKVMSNKLTSQEEKNTALHNILQRMNNERLQLSKELGEFNEKCDPCLKDVMNELHKKRDELQELKQQVVDCACKFPIDEGVEAKRTPSLALMCECLPEDMLEEPCEDCSCVSLHTNLLNNLLTDLFCGLKTELGTTVNMPCEILKCLEDSFNWNKSSPIKIKLLDFFSNLLLKELDIAIATSIEHYHAKWISATCTDTARILAETQEEVAKAQARICEREIEERAHEIAQKLADQLFREKADKLAAQRAKEILASGPPPCECLEKNEQVFPCLLEPKPMQSRKKTVSKMRDYTSYWFKTHENVSHIRNEIARLKKDTIRKGDLRSMEKKLTSIVQRATNTDFYDLKAAKEETNLENKYLVDSRSKCVKFERKNDKSPRINKSNQIPKKTPFKRQMMDNNFAVNICMCDSHNINKVNRKSKPIIRQSKSEFNYLEKHKTFTDKQIIQDIMSPNVSDGADKFSLLSSEISCEETCVCLNKVPSNTSIKELLNTLIKWQNDIQSPANKSFNSSFNSPNIPPRDEPKGEIKRQYHILNEKDTLLRSLSKYSTIKINDNDAKDQYCSPIKKINEILTDYQSLSSNGYVYELGTKDLKEKNEDTVSHKQGAKCNYSVKFLGMTLVDKNNVDKNKIRKADGGDYNHNVTKSNKNHNKYQDKKSKDGENENISQSIVMDVEFKSNNETEKCICCESNSKELEQNTFQLLQEHLTMKLKGYIKTQCKSNCIKSDDEQKILHNIFNKIKEVTNEIQDTRRNQVNDIILENSWNRALGLLKEYLSVKMKKAHKNSEQHSDAVHDELHKKTLTTICDLINNDFNRIKALCICNKNNKQTMLENKSHVSKSCSPFSICSNKIDEKSVHFLGNTKTQTYPSVETHFNCVNYNISQNALSYNESNSSNKSPNIKNKSTLKDLKVTIDKLDIFNENNNNNLFVHKVDSNLEGGSQDQFLTISDCLMESRTSYLTDENSNNNILQKSNEEDNESVKLVLERSPRLLERKSMITNTDNLDGNLSFKLSKSDEDISSNMCSTSNDIFSKEEINKSFNLIMNASKNANIHSDEPKTMVEDISDCECKTLPMCYVKMLVDGIENLLLAKKCTCYFSKKLCPIHSKKS